MTKVPKLTQYFEFFRYALNPDGLSIPDVKELDWNGLYRFANEQAIAGFLFEGVKRLSEQGVKPPFDVLMQWIALSEQIAGQNRHINNRCLEIVKQFKEAGFQCVVLKGQGNALMYPNPLSRCPGDIDLLVKGNKKDIINYVKQRYPHTKTAYQHIDYPVFKDVEVELHYLPTYRNNPIYNHRFQKWYNTIADGGEMMEEAELPEGAGTIPVPTVEFNIVFQLAHMMHHFFDEGIGLRQMMDYYYLLCKVHDEGLMVHGYIEGITKTLKYLNLYKFAGAVMYVMQEVFALEEQCMIAPVDERRGKTLLYEILKGGNFGHYSSLDQRHAFKKYFQKTWRNIQLVKEYPAEALCEPFFRTWHFFWRMAHR